MITRRQFTGVATCAICAAAGLVPAGAAIAADAPAGAKTSGLTRRLLSQTDGPAPGYTTIIAEVTIEPGVTVARHTHPGIESGYLVEGDLTLSIEGMEPRHLKPGDGFQVPVGRPHAGDKNGPKRAKVVSTYVVEKGKPLASPA
ncbi:MAG: cupin domain-containing protein [Stellaceae bacterium]